MTVLWRCTKCYNKAAPEVMKLGWCPGCQWWPANQPTAREMFRAYAASSEHVAVAPSPSRKEVKMANKKLTMKVRQAYMERVELVLVEYDTEVDLARIIIHNIHDLIWDLEVGDVIDIDIKTKKHGL